jgi:hypothetical protein
LLAAPPSTAIVYSNPTRPDLYGLGKTRNRNREKGSGCGCDEQELAHQIFLHFPLKSAKHK